MADIQIDVGFAILFIAWPVYHLLTSVPYTKKDDHFYTHLTKHSAIFPRWRWIFPLVWTLLWSFNGAGAFLFWHAYSAADNDTTYLVGLIFYTISFVFQCGWYNMFFKRRALKSSFWVTFIVIWGSAVGYFVCTILYPEIVSAVAAGLMVAWLTYATVMCYVAAYWVPDHHSHKVDEERLMDGESPAHRGDSYYMRGGYDASGAQVTQQQQQQTQPPASTPAALPVTTSAKFQSVGNPITQRKTVPTSSLVLPGAQ
jgi:tryptophan-rich sensory protein